MTHLGWPMQWFVSGLCWGSGPASRTRIGWTKGASSSFRPSLFLARQSPTKGEIRVEWHRSIKPREWMNREQAYLLSNCWVLESMQSLIECACILINVHNHGSSPFAWEKALEDASQFALPERNNLGMIPRKENGTSSFTFISLPYLREECYLFCWLCLRVVMHRPRVKRDVLMLPASLMRSPKFWVFAYLSEPARSQKDNLRQVR